MPSRSRQPLATLRLSIALALSALAAEAHARNANDYPYPRLGLYGSIRGWGYPLIDSSRTGPLDMDAIRMVARYHEVSFDASPITEYRPEVIAALRQENPDITVLAYVVGHEIWNAQDEDSLVHYPTRYRRLVRDHGGFILNTLGQHFTESNVNLGIRDSTGRYVLAEKIAELWWDAILRKNIWDGLMIDIICDRILWMQSPRESIDLVSTGFATWEEFEFHWSAGSTRLSERIRELAGPDAVLVGNCSLGTKYHLYNGWMREDFPFQSLGTWHANMFRVPGGYFTDEANFLPPRHNYIFSSITGSNEYDEQNTRRARLGLASATLGDGFGVFGNKDRDAALAPFHEWWYDEYAVDLPAGTSSDDIGDTGWLGMPFGVWYQHVWLSDEPDVSTNPSFEDGLTNGWIFNAWAPGTITRDFAHSIVGPSSARIDVPAPAPADYFVHLATAGTLDAQFRQTHTATFWARASSPRQITVAMSRSGGGFLTTQKVTIGTGWKRHSVQLLPEGTGPSRLQFYLGADSGSVWFDDVHFQYAVSCVYRRDFERGSVLVNPATRPVTVRLKVPMRRILGLRDPAVNDGALADTVRIQASDGMFLIRTALPTAVGDGDDPSGRALFLGAPAPSPGRAARPTTFPLVLAAPERVWLELVDATGRRVARRDVESLGAGRHALRWDPGPLEPGLYLVVARTPDGDAASRKWVVLD